MKRAIGVFTIVGCLVTAAYAAAQTAPAPSPMSLWPGRAPGAKGSQPADVPSIALYRAALGSQPRAVFVVCPGGGYVSLADHEGRPIAQWLNSRGMSAVVLTYRLGPRYSQPAPGQDVARAIRTLRAHAAEWGVDPARVGVIGFSAGGHLAATAATSFDEGEWNAADPIERFSSRPDVAVLAYPVISMADPITHRGSRVNLLGKEPSQSLVDAMSAEKQVTPRTPPTFIFHTADDPVVPVQNALRFAVALQAAHVPYDLHIFEHGPHGVGLAEKDPTLGAWTGLLEAWLRVRRFITDP